jgi:hypothetical protein
MQAGYNSELFTGARPSRREWPAAGGGRLPKISGCAARACAGCAMIKVLRAFVLIIFAIIAIPFAILLFIRSKLPRKRTPPRPVTEADFLKAEKKLGFALPDELKAFFTPPQPTLRVDCAERYTLGESVAQYRMVTKTPYGPNGQDWPRELFPVADLLPGYACYHLESGLVTEWDPEDLGEDDDDPRLWDLSFKKTGKSLSQWIVGEAPRQ